MEALLERRVRGVLESHALWRAALQKYMTKPFAKLPERIKLILLVATYRLFCEDIAPAVVVDAAVTAVCSAGGRWAKGMTNAVLRRVAEDAQSGYQDLQKSLPLNARYSVPESWVNDISESLGKTEELEAALDGLRRNPGAHVWPVSTTTPTIGASLKRHAFVRGAFVVCGNASEFLHAGNSEWNVQDAGILAWARLAAESLTGTVWDPFCAPGGKMLALTALSEAQIVGSDKNKERLALVRRRMKVLGRDVPLEVVDVDALDGPQADGREAVDHIIADCPCSASGTLGRRPDVALHRAVTSLADLQAKQVHWLDRLANYVKEGGSLWYCTCSILRQENEEVVDHFLGNHPGWAVEPHLHPIDSVESSAIRFWPHLHQTAGFCAHHLRRVGENPT